MSGLFAAPPSDTSGPRWFNIAADRPFALDLARGLTAALAGGGPDALSQATVLTPTRRGARELARAFAEAGGGRALLPPQLRPLGDLDEGEPPFEPGDIALDLPAAIDPMRRRFELMRLTCDHAHLLGRSDLRPAQALEYADALGSFFDSLQIEEVAVGDRLAALVEADLAEHWQVSQVFLEATLEAWPARLAALGLMDVSERRAALLRRLAESWSQRPPPGVLVAAGSTGTAPATRALLIAIAAAPQGLVVLPGLDGDLAAEAWAEVDDPHPQGALKRLLDAAGVTPGEVRPWPGATRATSRLRVVNEALRPARRTSDWLGVIADLRAAAPGSDPFQAGLEGLSLVTARNEDQAAGVAAVLLRQALETPGKTAALITPDQALGRRVAAKLARWGIIADASIGDSLAGSRCGVLAALMARAALDPHDPVALLALAKHPDARLGLAPEVLDAGRQALERDGLRGARPGSFAALEARLGEARAPEAAIAAALTVSRRLRTLMEDLLATFTDGRAGINAVAQAVAHAMEALAADEAGGSAELWRDADGEAMSRLLAALIAEGSGLSPVTALGFGELLGALMAAETVRAPEVTHPRLRILGAIEARMVRADLVILGGLEEGVWPRGAPLDPFLSRPMRAALGLPAPERRVGLQAHDFAQAACGPQVVLLHAERREGAPSVKSRWLWRLETLARGAGVPLAGRPEAVDWADGLDAPGPYRPIGRPGPTPPTEDRPKGLYVTRVEALTRDPYAVWARDILKLRAMDRPDAPVEATGRGTAIHTAFERFVLAHPRDLPADGAAIFQDLYITALSEAGVPREALAREGALAREAAVWVMDLEARRRAGGVTLHVEREGHLTLMVDGDPFTVSAKTDRLEVTGDGRAHVLDYKTGAAPTGKMVKAGFAPQLTLTAAILAGGGFRDIGPKAPGELVYIQVTGRRPAGKDIISVSEAESADAAAAAKDGLIRLIRRFRDPAHPYASRVAPQYVYDQSDYHHLARVFEWSTGAESAGE